jgi:hypothetical protein
MKIGLDVRMIQSSGIGTTIRGLIENLSTDQQSSLILYGLNNWKTPDINNESNHEPLLPASLYTPKERHSEAYDTDPENPCLIDPQIESAG